MSVAQTETPAACVEYASLLRRLHEMIAEGTDELDEGDSLRDAMDGVWDAMNEEEVRRSRTLSADLYTRNDPDRQEGPGLDPADWLRRYDDALASHDWDGLLALIREDHGPWSPSEVMSARARWWLQLGDGESALLFATEAARLGPRDGNIAFLRARILLDLGREEEAIQTLAHFAESHPASVPPEHRETLLVAVAERRQAIEAVERSTRRLRALAEDYSIPAA